LGVQQRLNNAKKQIISHSGHFPLHATVRRSRLVAQARRVGSCWGSGFCMTAGRSVYETYLRPLAREIYSIASVIPPVAIQSCQQNWFVYNVEAQYDCSLAPSTFQLHTIRQQACEQIAAATTHLVRRTQLASRFVPTVADCSFVAKRSVYWAHVPFQNCKCDSVASKNHKNTFR
jgi:hypothetical protein